MELKIEVPVVVTPKPSHMAIMREALEKAELGLFRWMSGTMNRDEHRELVATIKEALAEPARNCEVGTVEDQLVRFDRFCGAKVHCRECVLRNSCSCKFAWAQLPYVGRKERGVTK